MQDSQHYRKLTLQDVEQWAGPDLAFRARSYVRRVEDLRLGPDGQLLGWVEGSSRYVTQVTPGAGSSMKASCTCGSPKEPCKHAVALLMAAMFRLQDGGDLPRTDADDIRLGSAGVAFLPIEKVAGHGKQSGVLGEHLVKRLGRLKKGQLVNLIVALAEDNKELAALVALRLNPDGKDPGTEVAWLRDSLYAAAERPGWKDPRSGEQFTPDYGPVERGLVTLVEQGNAVEVIRLGETLCDLANQQLAETEDDGETQAAIVECLAVVLAALERSPLDAVERICWYWDRLLEDPYHLFDGLDQPRELDQLDPAQWREVAAVCRRRLQDLPGPDSSEDWQLRHQRRGLLDYATTALEHAGEQEAATALFIAELPYTGNYQELVAHLAGHQALDQARQWAVRGFGACLENNPAESWRLVERLVELAEREGDALAVAALRVEQFIHHPTLSGYHIVKKAAGAAHWPVVRTALLHWLASADSPQGAVDWPLPDSGLDADADSRRVTPPCPHHALLIEIALDEGDYDTAVCWHQQAPAYANHAEMVADRVRDSHPDISLAIWSARVETLVHEARTADYARARPYLEGIRDLYRQMENDAEINAFFSKLRRRHKAKRRFLEVIDAIQMGEPKSGD